MALEIDGITAGYTKEVPILGDVNVTAREGRVTVIIGPNGAGKSTLLKVIAGYLPAQAGDVRHDGESIIGLKPKDMLRYGIAYLIQGHSTFPKMTVAENLEMGAWLLGRDKQAIGQAFEAVYTRYPRLKEKRRTLAGQLSGGERRMLEIARLTMTGPRTLLLDEPSVGLMPKLVDSVYDEIARLKAAGYTILMVDQNVRKAMDIADYVYVLQLGENSHEGPRDDIAARLEAIIKEWI